MMTYEEPDVFCSWPLWLIVGMYRHLTYLLTYLLTPWKRVLLEKLAVSAASQEIPRIFGTRRFITVLTSARHLSLSWTNSIQSPQPPPTSWRSILIWCDFDRASSLICRNKMPTTCRCNRGFYCRSYCLLNMFRASLCPSSGAQEYYTVVAACGILCCGFSSSWSGVELRVN